MIKLNKFEIQKLIDDDLPYEDLTVSLQNINKNARLEIFTREDLYVSCTDVCIDIANLFDIECKYSVKNGDFVKAQGKILEFLGSYENIHKIWKVCQITLEWVCKISTYTKFMDMKAKSVNSECEILTTRKTFPFAKKLCLKAVLEGGGCIHRQSLSDSILFFQNHINAYGSFDEFCTKIPKFKARMPEKKIMVECGNISKIQKLLTYGVDGIQCDKLMPNALKEIVKLKNIINKNAVIIASGGINLNNVAEFAITGINAVTTSAPYNQGMADLTSKIEIVGF